MFRRFTLAWATRSLLAALALVVCLPPLDSQKLQQPVATVLDCTGQVSVLDGEGGYQVPVAVKSVIRQAQTIVTGPDGWARFQYSDGSTFEVFPKSKVLFQEHPADFEHLLNVVIGHIKVWIQHAPGVPNYKNVSTPTAVISVRGTIFSVEVEDEDTTVVSVEEGLVDVRNTTAITGNRPLLTTGQSITVIRGVPLAMKGTPNNVIRANVLRAAEQVMYQVLLQKRIGGAIGMPGGPAGGAQGDRGKKVPGQTNGGKSPGAGAPAPPAAPTPPPAPPPPGGGGGD